MKVLGVAAATLPLSQVVAGCSAHCEGRYVLYSSQSFRQLTQRPIQRNCVLDLNNIQDNPGTEVRQDQGLETRTFDSGTSSQGMTPITLNLLFS